MTELRTLTRTGPQTQALHVSYEKAGLTLHDAAVPWNADAVVVEVSLRLPPVARRKNEFTIRLPGRDALVAESLRPDDGERYRLFFRLPTPETGTAAELYWREHSLSHLTISILSYDEYLKNLRVDMPTVFARIGEQTVACQTFVASQCKGLQANAVLAHRGSSLAPLAELGPHVQFRNERDGTSQDASLSLSGSQLQSKQALTMATPHKLPRRMGVWTVTWEVDGRVLATQRVKAISKRAFHQSLRVSDTRFVVVDKTNVITLQRQLPPLSEVSRVGPCFLVSSREGGMAGLCHLRVHAQIAGGVQSPLLLEHEVLVTDAPTMVAPGTLDVADLAGVNAFDLRHGPDSLGMLALSPVPTASFTREGGYKPPVGDFLWTPAAEEELSERLNRLVNGM